MAIADHERPPSRCGFNKAGYPTANRDDGVGLGEQTVLQPIEERPQPLAVELPLLGDRVDAAVEIVSVIDDPRPMACSEWRDSTKELERMKIEDSRRRELPARQMAMSPPLVAAEQCIERPFAGRPELAFAQAGNESARGLCRGAHATGQRAHLYR